MARAPGKTHRGPGSGVRGPGSEHIYIESGSGFGSARLGSARLGSARRGFGSGSGSARARLRLGLGLGFGNRGIYKVWLSFVDAGEGGMQQFAYTMFHSED